MKKLQFVPPESEIISMNLPCNILLASGGVDSVDGNGLPLLERDDNTFDWVG